MATFTRENVTSGSWQYRVLATAGSSVPSTVPANRVLNLSETDVTKAAGLWSTTYSQIFTVGHASRRKMASKLSQPRSVVFTITSGDTTGAEARMAKRFFTWDGPITYRDAERTINPVSFYVTAIDDSFYSGSVTLTITGTTVFSDETIEDTAVLLEDTAITSTYTFTKTGFKNTLHTDATLRAYLKAKTQSAPVDWKGFSVKLSASSSTPSSADGSVTISAATQGDPSLGFIGYAFTADSIDECIEGSGVVIPESDTRFFSIPSGGTSTLNVVVTAPENAAAVTLGVKLVSTFARGTWGVTSGDDAQ